MKPKQIFLSLLLLCGSLGVQAQTFYVCEKGNVETAGEMSFAGGGSTLNGKMTSGIDSITTHVPDLRFVGGDISMLPKYEEKGAVYKDINGQQVQPLQFFKQEGLNAMRVRLFVDPSKASDEHKKEGVIQDLDYVIRLGQRIKQAGFLFMVDFHYSDTWTDPGKHSTPSGWSGNAAALAGKLYEYTRDCLQQLNAAGASPDFIQVGNEVTYGMLWPTGHVYPAGGGQDGGTWENFASYLNSGIRACREVCPRAKVVLHTEMSKTQNVINFYNQLPRYGVSDYDVIGLSYYPAYHGALGTLNSCLTTLENQYKDKKIMVVETGYSYAWAIPGTTYDYTSVYPYSEEGQRRFTADLISTLRSHANVNGLFWWWPEANENNIDWQNAVTSGWWNASLFNNSNGVAYKAFYELKNFK